MLTPEAIPQPTFQPFVKERTNYSSYLQQHETTSHTHEHVKMGPLTTGEVLIVNLATIRDSVPHLHWPEEVVERFLAIKV